MMPTPEPAGDIRAQLAAVMDPHHKKQAAFIVPKDEGQIPFVLNAFIVKRAEGTLVTVFEPAAEMFTALADDPDGFDAGMAVILGIPEPKPLMVQRCGGRPELYSRAVQARDGEGNVVQEGFASPAGLHETVVALEAHVPVDGALVIMNPVDAIRRRIERRG